MPEPMSRVGVPPVGAGAHSLGVGWGGLPAAAAAGGVGPPSPICARCASAGMGHPGEGGEGKRRSAGAQERFAITSKTRVSLAAESLFHLSR